MAERRMERLRKILSLKKNLTQEDIDWEIMLRLSFVSIQKYKKLSEKDVAQATANLANQFTETSKLAKHESVDILKNGYSALELYYNDICKGNEPKAFLYDAIDNAIEECLFVERINHTRSPRYMS